MEELVSIITPVYNAEKFLHDTINSVLEQDYKNWEMILVDDCSKDNSEKIIREYEKNDKRIKYIKLEKNVGAAKTRNLALEQAKGRYIAFLDSDDVWKKNKLSKQIKFMKDRDIGFSFTEYEVMSEDGELIGRDIKVPKHINYNQYLKNTIIGCLTVIIDKEKIGDFRMVDIRKNQDMATWLSILKKGVIAHGLNENLAKYRLVKGSISNNKFKTIKTVWNTYRYCEKLSLIKSIYCFICYGMNAVIKRI